MGKWLAGPRRLIKAADVPDDEQHGLLVFGVNLSYEGDFRRWEITVCGKAGHPLLHKAHLA